MRTPVVVAPLLMALVLATAHARVGVNSQAAKTHLAGGSYAAGIGGSASFGGAANPAAPRIAEEARAAAQVQQAA
jgi:hypothetical protein